MSIEHRTMLLNVTPLVKDTENIKFVITIKNKCYTLLFYNRKAETVFI